MSHSNTTTTSSPNTLNYKEFRNGYTDYNRKILTHSKTEKWKKKNKREWSHKQLCMQHQLHPDLIQKHFTNAEMPLDLFKMCQCGITKEKVKKQYKPILRLSLDKALEKCNWKMKSAHFSDLNIKINEISQTNHNNKPITNTYTHNKIQMLKIKIGAVKRYTQPKTEKNVFSTATFFRKAVFWQLGPQNKYILEIRLKSRECKEEVSVDINKTAKDVAKWWYQCWGLHGIRQEKKHNKTHQFFAIHDNTFVHKTSLHRNVKRISLRIHKFKTNKNDINATINGIPMVDIQLIKQQLEMGRLNHCNNNNNNNNNNKKKYNLSPNVSQNLSQNSSQNSSQAQPRSQTPSQTYSCTASPNCNRRDMENNNSNFIGIGNGICNNKLLKRSSSWNINHNNNKEMYDEKDVIIQELRNEIKEKEIKISKLEQQNLNLTVSLRRLNRDIMPLSYEMRLTPPQPPLKKRRLSDIL